MQINGSAIDLRTQGGYIVLPGPDNGRAWLKPLTTPLATIPKWIAARASCSVTAYGRGALKRACRAIETAQNGAQEATLNRECYGMGQLVGGGEIDYGNALDALTRAAQAMPAYAEPWGDLSKKVRRAVEQGMATPRTLPNRAAKPGKEGEARPRGGPRQRLDYSEDRRPRFEVPDAKGELTPVMRLLDEQLLTDEDEPPMRSADGWPVEVRVCEPIRMHELTASSANNEEGDNSRLPAPKLHTLVRHTQCSMALTIERYVAFFKRTRRKDTEVVEVPKRLPGPYVTHYLDYSKSRLPCVSALATMPLVLSNGQLLTKNGLDRARRIVFRIDPKIVELMPAAPPEDDAVEHAIKFLTDEWLVDVQTDYPGKCVLIALALSIIERDLLAERPAFFITAGKRGGGKTTVMNMIALAVLGKRAPAMSWSRVEEERRKSIFAALLQSVPLIVWDNIAAGSALSCPVVEKALTASEMEDRVLKELRNERVASTAIMAFTGNNILPKGDLASRVLMARITVNRPDPENRTFRHADPFGWTLDHRGEIIEALYTILLGNPRLTQERKDEKTRFKQWWRLVGSAVEHAAELAGAKVDFSNLFLDVESNDEEAASLAEVLQCLDRLRGIDARTGLPANFRSADVLGWATGDSEDARPLNTFFGGAAQTPTTRGITRKLNSVADSPVRTDTAVLTLAAIKLSHGNQAQFGISSQEIEHTKGTAL